MMNSSSPVNPHASASRNVLQDMRKNSAVSSNGKSLSLVNLVTWKGVNESNLEMYKQLNALLYTNSDNHMNGRRMWLQPISLSQAPWFIRKKKSYIQYCTSKGYQSSYDSSCHSKSKRTTEDAQEDAKGLQHGHGFKCVSVVSLRLICYNWPGKRTQTRSSNSNAKPALI